MADLDLIIAHQANQRILDAIGHRLKLPPERLYSNVRNFGNTSSSTIPICLSEVLPEVRPARRSDLAAFEVGSPSGPRCSKASRSGILIRVRRMSGAAPVGCAEPGWRSAGVASPESSCFRSSRVRRDLIPIEQGDKAEHILAYGMLMFWFAQIYLRLPGRIVAAALLVAPRHRALEYAGLDRVAGILPYADMAADAVGVGLGWLLAPPRTRNLLTFAGSLLLRRLS